MIKLLNYVSYGIKRLESKNAIVQKLATNFNLIPIIAEEPAGKHIKLTSKVTLTLKPIDNQL